MVEGREDVRRDPCRHPAASARLNTWAPDGLLDVGR